MSSADSPPLPMPSPRLFFAVALAAGLFAVVWSWLALAEKTGPESTSLLASFDWRCAQHWKSWVAEHPGLAGPMIYLTDFGGVAVMAVLTIMGMIWQASHEHRVHVAAWFLIVVGGTLLGQGCKIFLDRDRPGPELRADVVHERNKSYPSGHSMSSIVGYGILGYVLLLQIRCWRRRLAAVVILPALVLAIGFSRIYLRAHWFSDVVGGFVIGLSWLCLCLGWLESRRRDTCAKPPSEQS